jgi:calcineurin-like phosphoesterase
MLKILFLGDVIGEPGRRAVIDTIPKFKEERGVDFVIVNGENSANGRGITPRIAIDLLRAGAAVITSGDHIWDQKDIVPYMDIEPRLLRPLNYPDGTPGGGLNRARNAEGQDRSHQRAGTHVHAAAAR